LAHHQEAQLRDKNSLLQSTNLLLKDINNTHKNGTNHMNIKKWFVEHPKHRKNSLNIYNGEMTPIIQPLSIILHIKEHTMNWQKNI
jgi:hypothetical protein